MNAYEFIVKMKNYASSELKKVATDLGIAEKKGDKFNWTLDRIDKKQNVVMNSASKLRRTLVGLFAGLSVGLFVGQVIEARQEYEKFDAVLTNTFQSKEVGQGALAMLTDFSAKTPYQLNEVTGSFIKLANRGIAPTYLEMTKMGDLASSQGKSFDQLTEAIMDAQTGEFERMKEFGIRASKAGDKVSLTFKGVTKTVQMNDKAIKDAIITYGEMAGVAGSMDVISKTLGGRISNLKDQWWGFLVAVGGMSSGVFGDVISMLDDGLAFLTAHLPQISMWFEILWQNISPVVDSIKEFLKAAFGFTDASSSLETFGTIMNGILLIVDWFAGGLSFLLDNLQPIAPLLATITGVIWLFNFALYANPIGLVIAAIVALIVILGAATKYTDGWGKSFSALGNLLKLWWAQVKADFNLGVNTAIYHFNRLRYSAFEIFDKIGQKISNVGKAIKQALDFDFSGAYDSLNKEVTSEYTKKLKDNESQHNKNIKDYAAGTVSRLKQAKKEVGDIGISIDTNGVSNDMNKLKKVIGSATGEKQGSQQDYKDYLNKNKGLSAPGSGAAGGKDKDKKGNKKGEKDGIVSGGSKQTHITINIDKVGTDTKIYVSSAEKGVKNLGEKVSEELLRAVNSTNQLQNA